MNRATISQAAAAAIVCCLWATDIAHAALSAKVVAVARVPVRDENFVAPDGSKTRISTYRGKVVVLNFWATWCGPCVSELGSLDRLARTSDPKRLVVLAVAQDKGGALVAKPFLDRLAMKALKANSDPNGTLMRRFAARGLPTTLILNPQGEIVGRVEGAAEWDRPAMKAYLAGLAR